MMRAMTLFLLVAGLPGAAHAQTRLEGPWSGSGSVVFGSGAKEQARCRARYTRRSEISYFVNATCASASVKLPKPRFYERPAPIAIGPLPQQRSTISRVSSSLLCAAIRKAFGSPAEAVRHIFR